MLQNVRQIAHFPAAKLCQTLPNSVLQFRKLSQPLLFLEMKQLLEKSARWRRRQSLCGSQTLADGWETSVMELAGRQQQLTELSSTNSVTLLHFPPPAGSLHSVEPTLCWTSTTDPGPAMRVATDLQTATRTILHFKWCQPPPNQCCCTTCRCSCKERKAWHSVTRVATTPAT